MKIHSIALTKNEEDVIEDCLMEAVKWSDCIYVYDGQSTDRTWEIVKGMKHPAIIPWKQDGKVFQEWLRAEVFNEFKSNAAVGDWWGQLNVDEYYIDPPKTFLGGVNPRHHVVWANVVQYYITPEDLTAIDFSRPWGEVRPLLRYYQADYSELRFFRHRPGLRWGEAAWPFHLGVVALERIRFKHYPLRSPQQIQTRLDTRRNNRQRGFTGWEHASQESWREKLVDRSACTLDKGDGNYLIDESRLPRHLESFPRRIVKQAMHGLGLWA